MLEPAVDVSWGGYTVTLTAIFGLSKMVQSSDNWDYFINLSASDFPLLPQVLLTSNKRIGPFSFAWKKLTTPVVFISMLHYLIPGNVFVLLSSYIYRDDRESCDNRDLSRRSRRPS